MLKKLATIFAAILMMIVGFALLANGQNMDINITKDSKNISVIENVDVDINLSDLLYVWVPNEASNVSIEYGGTSYTGQPDLENIYKINLTQLGVTSTGVIEIKYDLDKNTNEFREILKQDVAEIKVNFNENEIYTATDLAAGSSFTIALIESETENIEQPDNSIYLYGIGLLIIIILILAYTSVKKPRVQKAATKKQLKGNESKELLLTKKALLMEVLKDIEKQHRAKKISDDTYNKLKDQYKQDAVETMRQLDDLKSKVK